MIVLSLVFSSIFIFLMIYLIVVYNQIVKLKIVVDEAWSGKGTFLQQRLDLIPNLVETVKGFAGHENKTLQDVIKARNESINALTPEAQLEAAKHMGAALINFKSLSEQYPELKANENFMFLSKELVDIEEKINRSRRYFNATVRNLNQGIAVFPNNIVANLFGFKPREFFLESEASAVPPKVQF